MSDDVTYAIVFAGGIVEGFQSFQVKAHLGKMLKADADKMATLFSGKPIVLKRTASKQEAAKYGTALKKVGADIKVRVVKGAPPARAAIAAIAAAPGRAPAPNKAAALSKAAAPAKPAAAAKPAATPVASAPDTSAISLAPNEGNLVDPSPDVAAPALDLSGIELAENDGTPLVPPSEMPEVSLDLSEYGVAEKDGSPLVAPSAPVPKLDAPDFGLDEPGAVLETIQEEKVLLNPDTSSLSLADTGADLLTDDDKGPEAIRVAPDVSQINLTPNP